MNKQTSISGFRNSRSILKLINIGAHTLEIDNKIFGFFLRDVGEKVCVVGFSKRRLNLRRYEIKRCLFVFLNLGHEGEAMTVIRWKAIYMMPCGPDLEVSSGTEVNLCCACGNLLFSVKIFCLKPKMRQNLPKSMILKKNLGRWHMFKVYQLVGLFFENRVQHNRLPAKIEFTILNFLFYSSSKLISGRKSSILNSICHT